MKCGNGGKRWLFRLFVPQMSPTRVILSQSSPELAIMKLAPLHLLRSRFSQYLTPAPTPAFH